DQQRRRVRFAAVDADRQPAAERHPGPARDPGPPRRGQRAGGDPADDVPGADLRSPDHRRPRSGDVPQAAEGVGRGAVADAAGNLRALMAFQLTITDDADEQFRWLTIREQRVLEAAIETRLRDQPAVLTKAVKRLRPNPLAEYELKVGDLRALYNVEG